MELRGKGAVVIGGGSGIGRGIALALADRGADVVVADLNLDTAKQVAGEVAGRGVRGEAIRADATDVASVEALADAAWDALGAVHVLSNNAGVVHLRPLTEADADDWSWVTSVNLYGIVHPGREFAARLVAQDAGGHIVCTSSLAGLMAEAIPGLGLYTATKHAVVGYCETLRGELAPHGIGVSVLCPGMVRSQLAGTSARQRPERYGGPMPSIVPEGEVPDIPGMISAELCGRITVRGIEDDRFAILTHPKSRSFIEERHQRLLADYDAAEVVRREEEAAEAS